VELGSPPSVAPRGGAVRHVERPSHGALSVAAEVGWPGDDDARPVRAYRLYTSAISGLALPAFLLIIMSVGGLLLVNHHLTAASSARSGVDQGAQPGELICDDSPASSEDETCSSESSPDVDLPAFGSTGPPTWSFSPFATQGGWRPPSHHTAILLNPHSLSLDVLLLRALPSWRPRGACTLRWGANEGIARPAPRGRPAT
jgi:hypothetical protein